MRLLDHADNIYSQAGEDGILAKVLDLLPERDKWCVEFGAWDGQLFSNTCSLIDRHDYSAVMIEGDGERFKDLLKRHGSNAKVIALNKFVGFDSETGLDALLANTPLPRTFDLLSIDIDGNDYHVWNALTNYEPKAVIIEFNATIPTELEFIQAADQTVTHGSSLLALTRLGKKKGYELVAVTTLNAIFVRSPYFSLFGVVDNRPEILREDLSHLTYIFAGYDGTIFLTGHEQIPWSGIKYLWRVQQLPKMFRRFPTDFGRVRLRLFKWYKKVLRWKNHPNDAQYFKKKTP